MQPKPAVACILDRMWDNRHGDLTMKAIDLTKVLKPYKSGWVAVDVKHSNVIAHAKSFQLLANKLTRTKKKNFVMIPASDKYFGFVTRVDV